MKIELPKLSDHKRINELAIKLHEYHVEWRPDIFIHTDEVISKEELQEMIANEKMFVAKEDNKVLGYIILGPIREDHKNGYNYRKQLELAALIVDDTTRNKGIGTALMKKALEYAKENNCTDVRLTVNEENEKAIKLYEKLGIDTMQVVNLFGNSKYAFWTVTATWVFYSGFNMLIFLGEMGAISPEIYEAAQVDGATAGQADRYIAMPLMKNAFGTCVILASVAMVSQFDIIYMTTRGGPGNSTLNLPMYLYKIITLENNYGKANAVGVIQIILGLVLVILIQRLFNQKKEIEEV